MSVESATVPSRSLDRHDFHDQQQLEDIGFMTCMTLVLLGNYAQTGHFGGPLAYTPFNVVTHLAGRDRGGLHFDYRRPKHPYSDKFMLAAGHCAPTCYALWMIMGEALARKYKATGDRRYYVAPDLAMLSVDALGFRRGAGALATLLKDNGLADHPLFAQAKGRGIRALSGHIESTDVTNDVNGGPSGIGVATAAGKAAFWDLLGADIDSPKIVAFEGEFAMCAGHAQELKTQAHGPAGRQAAPHLLLRQQRRHRRRAHRRRGARASSPTATCCAINGRRTDGTSSPSPTATTTRRSSAS